MPPQSVAQRLQPLVLRPSTIRLLFCRTSTGGPPPHLSHIEKGSQNETSVLIEEEVRRRKSMTIPEAIDKAVEGGYHIYGSDGMDTEYEGANSAYSVWTRKDNASSFIVPVEEAFLDPTFWQALGHALVWDHAVMTVPTVENGRSTLGTRAGHHWLSHWHRFIDHLAAGKTPAAFFESLPCSETVGKPGA